MPILTIQELSQISPIFRGKPGGMLARSLMHLLSIDKLNSLYDRNAHLGGADFAHNVLKDLGIRYDVYAETHKALSLLDAMGNTPFITISNHPYGSIDGIILADFFGHRHPNYKLMANKILTRVEALSPSFIPVTPTGVERTAATSESISGVRQAMRLLHSGGALGLFPSGAVSDFNIHDGRVRDRNWQPAIIRFIAKAHVPVLPVRFFDGNSLFYYLLGLIDWRIRLLRLPAEVFNKSNRPIRLGVGELISTEEQQAYLATHTIEEFAQWLRGKVYHLSL